MTQEQPPTPDSIEPEDQPSTTQDSVASEDVPSVLEPTDTAAADAESETLTSQAEASSASDKDLLGDESVKNDQEPTSKLTVAPEAISEPEFLSQPLPSGASRDMQSQTLRSLQQVWQTTQPTLKAGTIKTLRATIQVLEAAVARLEAEPTSQSAPTPQADSEPAISETSTLPPPAPSSSQSTGATSPRAASQRGWQRFWNAWKTVLPKIRAILPASLNQQLSNRALTGAIVGLLVILVWTTSSLFSSKPPTQVAISPPKSTLSQPTSDKISSDKTSKETPKPKSLPEVKIIPSPTPTPNPQLPTPPLSPQPTPSPVAEVPETRPQPEASPTPKPSPSPAPPPLKLTPEQTLIARIQDEVAEASDQSVNGLIQSVQANFRASRLTVKVSREWYNLPAIQQSKIANDVLKRTQQLNFVKLEMVDPQGNLLARSPVVGSEMVLLQATGA